MYNETEIDKVKELAAYVKGFADSQQNTRLSEAAKWLEDLSQNMCGAGFIGCTGGENCSLDHK